MSDPGSKVTCEAHGETVATFVCRHLVDEDLAGYHPASDPCEEDPWPDAWCDACEAVLDREGEWNEGASAYADIKIVCTECYDAARARHDRAFQQLVLDAQRNLKAAQARLESEWGLSKVERWHLPDGGGQLVFSNAGRAVMVANVEVVGSLSARSSAWLWGWAGNQLEEPEHQRMHAVRDFGAAHAFHRLENARWVAEEADGWDMAAVTVEMLGAVGAYRVPTATRLTFFALLDARRPD